MSERGKTCSEKVVQRKDDRYKLKETSEARLKGHRGRSFVFDTVLAIARERERENTTTSISFIHIGVWGTLTGGLLPKFTYLLQVWAQILRCYGTPVFFTIPEE